MSPNLFLATQKLFSPHKWFRENKSQERSFRKTEHWAEPIPGLYEYIPGRGWYLIAKEKEAVQETTTKAIIEVTIEGGPVQAAQEPQTSYEKLPLPISVHWSRVLKRYLLEPTYKDRKQHGVITNDKGKKVEVGFFRLDDGVAWVQCWDQHGIFIPGPYKLWCISARTGLFRPMLKGDDPKFAGSRGNSRSNSRNASIERQNSADSRSTQFYPPSSHASSNKDGRSVASTRPNSIRLTSPATEMSPSQPVSRRSSVKRNGSVEYENDKKAMRQMARDHREALMAAASIECADTKMGVEQTERGHTVAAKDVGA